MIISLIGLRSKSPPVRAVHIWTVLKNGKVCETGVTENIFNKPKHSYTKELLDLMPKIEAII